MRKYMMLMRGDQSGFAALPPEAHEAVIREHVAFSKRLAAAGAMVDGDGFASASSYLSPADGGVTVGPSPFAGTPAQLSGYYIIQAESDEAALAIARGCPALRHGESVELVALGH